MALPTLNLSLQFGDIPHAARHRAALPRHKVVRWIRRSLAVDGEITVRIVDADEGQRLNREFRKKDYATNVLTFDYAQAPMVMADLVLCAPVVAAEAKEQGKTLQAHYAHLLKSVFEKRHQIPSWLPMTGCPFCQNYCGDVRCTH